MDEKNLTFYIALASFVMPLILSAIVAWFIIAFQRKKHQLIDAQNTASLREVEMKLEKQDSLQAERSRIATEMHDDLGSGLTTINYLLQKLKDISTADEQKVLTLQIDTKTKSLVSNMSEIIWAMNDRYDNVQSLIEYMRRILSDQCQELNMPFLFEVDTPVPTIEMTGERRRNALLIIKETINNSIKYAQASNIILTCSIIDEVMQIIILEVDGIGFDVDTKRHLGNGLYNINKRVLHLHGSSLYEKTDLGMHITFLIPIHP